MIAKMRKLLLTYNMQEKDRGMRKNGRETSPKPRYTVVKVINLHMFILSAFKFLWYTFFVYKNQFFWLRLSVLIFIPNLRLPLFLICSYFISYRPAFLYIPLLFLFVVVVVVVMRGGEGVGWVGGRELNTKGRKQRKQRKKFVYQLAMHRALVKNVMCKRNEL
jgi:hypothetical protein